MAKAQRWWRGRGGRGWLSIHLKFSGKTLKPVHDYSIFEPLNPRTCLKTWATIQNMCKYYFCIAAEEILIAIKTSNQLPGSKGVCIEQSRYRHRLLQNKFHTDSSQSRITPNIYIMFILGSKRNVSNWTSSVHKKILLVRRYCVGGSKAFGPFAPNRFEMSWIMICWTPQS